jgi:hypothetical protein
VPRALERVQRFWQAVAAREAVQAIANDTEFYLARYRAPRPAAVAPTNGPAIAAVAR